MVRFEKKVVRFLRENDEKNKKQYFSKTNYFSYFLDESMIKKAQKWMLQNEIWIHKIFQILTPNSRGDILILWLVENPHILAKITKNHPILPEISKNIKFFHHYCCWQFWKVVKRDIQKYIGSQKLPGNERIRTKSDRSSIFRF